MSDKLLQTGFGDRLANEIERQVIQLLEPNTALAYIDFLPCLLLGILEPFSLFAVRIN